jgi:CRP/FNR family cyclic AMP-dependent transcriptional regulator
MSRLTPTEICNLLSNSALFRDLPPADLRSLAAHVHSRRYLAGELIMQKGQPGESMMVVVHGKVRIVALSENGSEVMLNLIGPRELFGEMAVLDGGPRSADAIALADTEVLTLHRAELRQFVLAHPSVALDLMAVLCRRVRETTQLFEDWVFLDFPTRFLKRLEVLAALHDATEGPDGLRIEHGLSQEHLADSVGVSRESVNKLLATWKSLGLVDHGRGYVVIRDVDALKAELRGRPSRD